MGKGWMKAEDLRCRSDRGPVPGLPGAREAEIAWCISRTREKKKPGPSMSNEGLRRDQDPKENAQSV